MQILFGDGEWFLIEILQHRFAPATFPFNWHIFIYARSGAGALCRSRRGGVIVRISMVSLELNLSLSLQSGGLISVS